MSLQVWLPLNKNVIENKGLSDVTITNNGATFVDAGIESCYQFNGQTSSTGNTIYSTNFDLSASSFSVCGWFKVLSSIGSGSAEYLICLNNNSYSGDMQFAILHRNGTLTVIVNNTEYAIDSIASIDYNVWHNFCLVFDGSISKLYINGELSNTKTITSQKYVGHNLNIGSRSSALDGSTHSYYSNICASDIRIYNHALSEKEVYELAKGLMFHLKLDNTDLYDCSGFGWNVSKYSNGTLTENVDTVRYSKCLVFDRAYGKFNTNIIGCNKVTVSVWAKPANANLNNLFGFNNTETSTQFSIIQTNQLAVRDNIIGPNGTRRYFDLGEIEANKWIHLVCIFDNGIVKIYKNGQLFTTGTTPGTMMNNTLNCFIGLCAAGSYMYYFTGSISDFRIYRTALTDEQVTELYKVGGSIDNHGNAHCYELNEK